MQPHEHQVFTSKTFHQTALHITRKKVPVNNLEHHNPTFMVKSFPAVHESQELQQQKSNTTDKSNNCVTDYVNPILTLVFRSSVTMYVE